MAITRLTPYEQIVRARSHVIYNNPFFGAIIMHLRLVMFDDPALKISFATDGYRLFVNAAKLPQFTPKTIEAAICHEVMHGVLQHSARLHQRNPELWNIAGDYVINLMLVNSNFQIGDTWLLDRQYEGMTTDEVYQQLLGSMSGTQAARLTERSPIAADITDVPDHLDTTPMHERPRAEQQDAQRSPQERTEAQELRWKMMVNSAAQQARMAGKVPAGLDIIVAQINTPRFNWRDMLRMYLNTPMSTPPNWTRPNRRFVAAGTYLPARDRQYNGHIIVAVDTSGSTAGPLLEAFVAELSAVHSQIQPLRLTVIYCDSHIARIDEFGPHDTIEITPSGGGGTDFTPPFEWVQAHAPEASCVIYLTDGYGQVDRGITQAPPTLWMCTERDHRPHFGDVVMMTLED